MNYEKNKDAPTALGATIYYQHQARTTTIYHFLLTLGSEVVWRVGRYNRRSLILVTTCCGAVPLLAV